MTRSKLGLLGLCVMVLGLMAFSASSASAAEWLILNAKGEVKTATELPAEIVGEFEPKTDGTLLTKLVGISLSVLCTAFTLLETKLESIGELTTGGNITFTGCTVPVLAGPKGEPLCTVKSAGRAVGTIATNKLKGILQTNGEILILPEAGSFAELIFEGLECPLPTVEQINGVIWVKDCEGNAETHLVKHLIVESKAHYTKDKKGIVRLGTLFIGKDTEEHLETYIDGSSLVFLSGVHKGLSWGAKLP